MGFVEDVQAWLEAVERSDAAVPVLPDGFDLERRRAAMWEVLSELPDRERRDREHARWAREGYLDAFVAWAVGGLARGLGARWSVADLEVGADEAVAAAIRGWHLGGVRGAEVWRLGRVAAPRAEASVAWSELGDRAEWARGVGVVGVDGRLNGVGKALVRLVGREAIHFVLELELALSTGPKDEHRVCRSALAALAQRTLRYDDDEHPDEWAPYNYGSMKRLAALGVAEHVSAPPVDRFSLAEDARDLIRTVLDPAPNPYRALVQALLDSERGRVTTAATGLAAVGADLSYVRMVVHELRNVSFPLSSSLSRLWRELDAPDGPDPQRVAELRRRIGSGMERISTFAAESARLAEAVQPEAFALQGVVEEAVTATEPDRNGRIRVDVGALDDAVLEGPRRSWVLVFVNLLRNAAQARAGSGAVWVSTEWGAGGALRILIDDDGPGVPEELREQIFGMGRSTRGGTGMGLHEVRTTVLLANGSIRCEASPRGGARFLIQVPARRRT